MIGFYGVQGLGMRVWAVGFKLPHYGSMVQSRVSLV